MKTMKKLFVIAVVILGFTANSFAQLSAIASITANIVSPTAISKVQDLNFGTIFTPTVSQGEVIVTVPSSVSGMRTASNPDILFGGTGNGVPAKFTINGPYSGTVYIDFPVQAVTLFSGIDFMNMDLDFSTIGKDYGQTITPGNNVKVTLDAGGLFNFFVGGKLYVGVNQAFGNYQNGTDLEFVINI